MNSERKAVVAYLTKHVQMRRELAAAAGTQARELRRTLAAEGFAIESLADAIERGEHLPAATTEPKGQEQK